MATIERPSYRYLIILDFEVLGKKTNIPSCFSLASLCSKQDISELPLRVHGAHICCVIAETIIHVHVASATAG